jgi:hypothetical protein
MSQYKSPDFDALKTTIVGGAIFLIPGMTGIKRRPRAARHTPVAPQLIR